MEADACPGVRSRPLESPMRVHPLPVVLALLLVLPALWMGARALADEPAPGAAGGGETPPAPAAAEENPLQAALARLEVLETKVAYLTSRERALTAFALRAEERARNLASALRVARQQGFTGGAISAPSREALLRGLETLAAELAQELPVLSKEEARLLQSIPKR